MKFRVGDRIRLYRTGSICTSYEEFAREHNLHKFVCEYDIDPEANESNNYMLKTPVVGKIVCVDGDNMGVDIGSHHIILYIDGQLKRYCDILPPIEPVKLDEGLFTL